VTDQWTTCVICEGAGGAVSHTFHVPRDATGFSCQRCGEFEIARSALVSWFRSGSGLDARQRAALSHQIRTADHTAGRPLITTYWMERFETTARLPNPSLQVANLIRMIGDHLSETGEGYFVYDIADMAVVGSFNEQMFNQLVTELIQRGTLVKTGQAERLNPSGDGVLSGTLYGLSLDGWERYELERRGKVAGRYGFMAMKFGNLELDTFAREVIKPAVSSAIGYEVVDLRDVSKAGIIDNLMREQIRDAAFVLVDLTHDNSGAYWEAGYAEGLGKPVIYICEREKFELAQTHFDTNHCTTVLYSSGAEDLFRRELIATLRRSLNLFGEG
jgi:hypothetical protein